MQTMHSFLFFLRPLLLATVCAFLLTGCGGMNLTGGDIAPNAKGSTIMKTAYAQMGKKYRYGGASPRQGFDCSGLVYWLYRTNGVKVPRSTKQQAHVGYSIPKTKAAPGDIVVFRTGFSSLHTGLYAGNNTFIHSPSKGRAVRVESLDAMYWKNKLVGVRRVTQ